MAPPRRSVTPRAVLIGLLLIPFNAYWVVSMELVRYSAHPTTISLFLNGVFVLAVLAVVNGGIARVLPRIALRRGEMLLVYSMLGIGTAMCGHDMLQVLVPMLAAPAYLSDQANRWESLFHGVFPHWLIVTDADAAKSFYIGNSTLYTPEHLRAWAIPVAVWGLFLFVLVFVGQCINVILRRQWTDAERLTYPLVRLPLEMTASAPGGAGTPPLTRNRLFWLGLTLAAGMDLFNSLHFYYPGIPALFSSGNGTSGAFDLGQAFTSHPWNAVGTIPVTFYPFVIGLGMLMPTDFLFSLWFFYLFWKLQLVAVAAYGWDADPRMPYAPTQSFGAYLLFFFSSLWMARGYLVQVWKCALGDPSTLDDRDEPIRYRTALLGIAAGLLLLIGFSVALGMAWWLAIVFFAIYFSLGVAITRMRAELGTPIHDLHQGGPDTLLPALLGTQLRTADLGVCSLYFWFNRAYRCQPMPIQLEAFKMAETVAGGDIRRADLRGWFGALLLAAVAGILAGFWALLHLLYQFGALAKADHIATYAFSVEAWNRLSDWIKAPKPPNQSVLYAALVGFGFALFLQAMRVRFAWWPFHPLAYAVSSSFEISLVWAPLCIAWIIKSLMLRYGGVRVYRASLPFFYGLMLGQILEGSLLNFYGILTDTPTYQFWQ